LARKEADQMKKEVAELLNSPGKVVVMPTDTLYGIVARTQDKLSVAKLYQLKQRDDKPGTIIAASLTQLEQLGLKHRYLKAVEQFWPGPISVIIPTSDPNLNYLTLNKYSIAVRIPKDIDLQKLLKITGPLLTTSANQPGKTPAKNIDEAKAYFGSEVDYYLDGGDLSNAKASTIIRIIDDAIEIVRPGAVNIIDGKIVA